MAESRHELAFALQIRALQLPSPEREYRFHPSKMWRFDFAWPAFRVAVEIDGGIHTGGRHVRGAGFVADCHKLNCAAPASSPTATNSTARPCWTGPSSA